MAVRWLLAVVIAFCAPAIADDQPWATGVSNDRKVAARKLLEQGNAQFVAKDYKAALATYESAIAVWDHPAIRFNVVRSLVQLDRLTDAFEHLELALKYGGAPLEEAIYSEALAYQKLLAGRIAVLSIKCDQPGVDVTLDGKPLGKCPLQITRRLEPGQHQVVGRLAGFQTRTRDLVVLGGDRVEVAVKLERGETGKLVYRWPPWLPWTTAVGGAAILMTGGVAYLAGRNQLDRFDVQYLRECPTSCETDLSQHPALRDQRDGALRKIDVGIAITVAGGAVAVAGVVWALVFNRPRRVPNVEVVPTGSGVRVRVPF